MAERVIKEVFVRGWGNERNLSDQEHQRFIEDATEKLESAYMDYLNNEDSEFIVDGKFLCESDGYNFHQPYTITIGINHRLRTRDNGDVLYNRATEKLAINANGKIMRFFDSKVNYTLSVNRYGVLRMTQLDDNKRFYTRYVNGTIPFLGGYWISQEIKKLLPQGIKNIDSMYPILKSWNVVQFLEYGYAFTSAFAGVDDVRTITKNLFGIKRMRKDLIRAVATAIADNRLRNIYVAWSFRHRTIATDWLIDIINNKDLEYVPVHFKETLDHVRRAFVKMSPRSQRRLVKELVNFKKDAGKGLPLYEINPRTGYVPPEDIDSFADFERSTLAHSDVVNAQHREANAKREEKAEKARQKWMAENPHGQIFARRRQKRIDDYRREAEQRERLAREQAKAQAERNAQAHSIVIDLLHEMYLGQHELIIATESVQLLDWGRVMSNCIASYSNDLHRKSDVFFALTDDQGKVLANGQIDVVGKNLVQFYGPYNQKSPLWGEYQRKFEALGISTQYTMYR